MIGLEKKRYLDLEKTLAKETEKVEKLTKKFSLAKKSIFQDKSLQFSTSRKLDKIASHSQGT